MAAGGRTIGGGCSPKSCCDEGAIDGVASVTNTFLTALRAGKSKTKVPADSVSGDGLLSDS